MTEEVRYKLRLLAIAVLVVLAILAFAYDISNSRGKPGEAVSLIQT